MLPGRRRAREAPAHPLRMVARALANVPVETGAAETCGQCVEGRQIYGRYSRAALWVTGQSTVLTPTCVG